MGSFATKSFDYGTPFTLRMDNSGGVSGVEPLYIGEADPGTATSVARWRIKKITYTAGTDSAESILWANGNMDFNNVWDNRASLTYT